MNAAEMMLSAFLSEPSTLIWGLLLIFFQQIFICWMHLLKDTFTKTLQLCAHMIDSGFNHDT